MKLGIFLDTNRQEEKARTKRNRGVGAALLRSAAVILIIATAWVLVGSAIYPLWWFEFVWKGGILNLELFKYGCTYLLNNESWLLVALSVFALAGAFIARRFWPKLSRLLDRFVVVVSLCCVLALSVDAFWLRKTQSWQYEAWSGLV